MLRSGFTQSVFQLIVGVIVLSSFALMIEVIPILVSGQQVRAVSNEQPLRPLDLQGKDIYIREGCTTCHTQMIRPLKAEVARYGPPSREEGPERGPGVDGGNSISCAFHFECSFLLNQEHVGGTKSL